MNSQRMDTIILRRGFGLKNLKRLWAIPCAVGLLAASACSGGDNDNANGASSTNAASQTSTAQNGSDAQAGDKQVSISFWHIYNTGPVKDLYGQLIDEFEQAHPNIKVKQVGYGGLDLLDKLNTALAGGTGPDLTMDDINGSRAKIKSGTLVNLQPYIDREQFDTKQYFPLLIDMMKEEGGGDLYRLPLETDVRVLFYNKAAFREVGLDPDKPPTTWDELETYADKLTKWDKNKLLERIGFAPNLGSTFFWTLAWTNGVDFFDDQGNPTINTPEAVETADWWIKMQDKYGTKAFSAFQSQSGSLGFDPFIAGKVAMEISTNNLVSDINVNQPDLEYGIAPIPIKQNNATWSAGWSLEVINNKDEAKAQAAWELMKFMTSADAQKRQHVVSNGLVGNQIAATDPEFMKDANWKTVTDQMQFTHFLEKPLNAQEWSDKLWSNIQAAVAGQIKPAEALEKSQREIEVLIANYNKANQ